MRIPTLTLAVAVLAGPIMAGAQQPADTAAGAGHAMTHALRNEIARVAPTAGLSDVPPADQWAVGGDTIAAGRRVGGSVAVVNGPLDISGHVEGNAIALHGDVIVHRGGEVNGDAVAIGGQVKLDGGDVYGEMRTLSTLSPAGLATARAVAPLTTWGAMKLVLGWFIVLVVIGIGVMMFAEHNLDGVVTVLERHLARAFWIGVLTELALLPALLVLVIALCITVIGILLVPFAIVAYVVAAAGLLALGFLAVARFTGSGFYRYEADVNARGASMRALLTGVTAYLAVWFVVAALTWVPGAQPVLRAIAAAMTWVALTAGLGATVVSRAGTQHERAEAAGAGGRPGPESLAWQTPTPVAGVSAARRPVSPARDAP